MILKQIPKWIYQAQKDCRKLDDYIPLEKEGGKEDGV